MSKVLVTEAYLQDIADAIREKAGGGSTYKPSQMGNAIRSIPAGGSGEWTTDGVAGLTEPNGTITISSNVGERAFWKRTGITKVIIQGTPYISNYAFGSCSGITELVANELEYLKSGYYGANQYGFSGCTGLTTVVFPAYKKAYALDSYVFQNCTGLVAFDINEAARIGATFYGCSALRTMVLRRMDAIIPLGQGGANGIGGIYSNPASSTIYVPSALIASYQTATNWAAVYNLNNNIFKSIEGSYYETHYADGTLISS